MSKAQRTDAAIAAITTHLPAGELTNEDLATELGDWTAAKIFEKSGIRTRRIAAENECASDSRVAAAQRLFEGWAWGPGDVDCWIFWTQRPDSCLLSSA